MLIGTLSARDYYPLILSLNGKWELSVDSTAEFSIENVNTRAKWRNAKVPLSWQAQFSDLRDYQGVCWYKKSFSIQKLKDNETAVVHFGAVDFSSEVFLNGKLVGKNENGYIPFDIDIRKNINPGKNEIIVRVLDPKESKEGTEEINYRNIPHGKQSWYIQTSGIWQGVLVKIELKKYIRQIHITSAPDGKFEVSGEFNSVLENKGMENLQLKIIDKDQKTVFITRSEISNSDSSFSIAGKLTSPKLWSFDSPNLYTLNVIFDETNKFVTKFGFRSIETKDKKLYLNGKPFYLIAALDQDFYPETIYTTPSEQYLRDEMLKAKHLGLNTLRCHIKVPDPLYLKVADEVGLLVWYEIPNWDVLNDEAKFLSKKTLEGMLARDWNHPSLVIISLINESWGIDLQKEDQRQWLKSEYNFAKEKAAGRLIVDNSACNGNFHIKTDLNDYHIYWSIPENYKKFKESVNEISNRPEWLFSSFGDAEETGKEPLLISEFGNWGLPRFPKQLPWWFDRKFGDVKPALPAGVTKRFHEYNYNSIFSTFNTLAEESQFAQFRSLKYEIEQIRLSPQIQGYVITEFTDINWESNGLMDMWRNPKIYAKELSDIQQQDIIIPRSEKYNYFGGDTANIKVYFSHYSNTNFDVLNLHWNSSNGFNGELKIPLTEDTDVKEVAEIKIPIQNLIGNKRIKINFDLSSGSKTIARNYLEIFSYLKIKNEINFDVYDPANKMESISKYLSGSRTNNDTVKSNITVTNRLDDSILLKLKSGENILCLTDTTTKLPALFPFKLISRDKDLYDGNWISNFNWMQTDIPPFDNFNFGKFLGFESVNCEPKSVLTEIQPENFHDVLAGMFVGWLHLNSAFIIQMNVGKGKLLLCTFPVESSIIYDPFTQTLFRTLIKYMNGENFAPEYSLPFN